jgi:hypothetical protein
MSYARSSTTRLSKLSNHLDQFSLDKFSSNIVTSILSISFLYNVVRYSREIFAGGNPFLTGDWLINYAGGYSGRGLNGQILLQFSDLTGLNLLWVTYFEQIGIYSTYVFTVIYLLRKVHDRFLLMISLSPVFIMFDFLDTGGAFRKEIIAFASLTLFIRMLVNKKFTWSGFLPVVLLYFLFAFSWEASIIFMLPMLYFTYQMKISRLLTKAKFVGVSLLFMTLSLSSLLGSFLFGSLILQFNTSMDQGRLVCDSLVSRGISPKICQGTIYSNTGREIEIPEMLRELLLENNFGYYFPILVLALTPFIWNGWIKRHTVVFSYFSISVLPIFLTGLDWGRWIHILGTIITLAWIAEKLQARDGLFENQIKRNSAILVVSSLLFIVLWRIPHAGGLPGAFLFGAAARVISWI